LAFLVCGFACAGPAFTSETDAVGGGGGGGSAGSTSSGSSGAGGGTAGSGVAGSHAGAGGTGGGGVDAGRIKNSGDCESTADCGGEPCVDISSGGYRSCVTKIVEATTCSNPPGQCCKTDDCTAAGKPGKCILGPTAPSCGGPVQIPTNVCAADECKSASDCPGSNAICVPAGVFGRKVATCLAGGCRRDSDCNEGPGGACLPVTSSCCSAPIGLFCVYKGGCVSDMDCPGAHCDTSSGKAVCVPGGVGCAAAAAL
jgi:hypothetical protein